LKRYNNLYSKIYDTDNLILADKKARKGKLKQDGVKLHDINRDDNIINLHHLLVNKEYKTSEYKIFKIFEEKERIIFQLPYYPDRILHHGVMNILEPIFVSCFTKDTYSCIKKRGIHGAYRAIKTALLDKENSHYCLKIDIRKFYPSVNHIILKELLRKKFKDNDLLELLDEIIDSSEGLPIGNYISQYLANFYLTYFDHWIKENKQIKYYSRYCDDIVILAKDKESLHILLREIEEYLYTNLRLKLSNHQIFPVRKKGIDFVGYRFFSYSYILLRNSTKKRFIKMIKYNKNSKSIASYNGWLKYCNSKNLQNKYLKNE
jgi:RNA-directed DNA polymerase